LYVGVAAGRGGGVPGAVVKLDRDRGDEVEVGQRAPCRFGSFSQGVEEHLGGFRDEGVAQPAVGDFAGETQVLRSHRGVVDRHRPGLYERLKSGATAVGQWQRIDLTGVFEAVSAGDDADDLHSLAGGLNRTVEPDAVPAFHDAGSGGSDAEQEAAVGQFLQAQCRRGQQCGAA